MANAFNISIKSTARARSKRGLNMRRVFAHHGVRVSSGASLQTIFPELRTDSLALAQRLGQLLIRAKDLAFEFDQNVRFGPRGLAKFLNHAVKAADRLGQDFIAYSAWIDGDHIQAAPRSFSGEALSRRRLEGFETALHALSSVGEQLGAVDSKTTAEALVAKILFDNFQVVEMKAYDVSQAGRVRISHSWMAHPEDSNEIARASREELISHFSDWKKPDSAEAMHEIVAEDKEVVLIEEPNKDSRAINETRPCVLIAERHRGVLTRIYKIDWETSWDHQIYARTIKGVFDRLAERKANIINERIEGFFDEIQTIVSVEKTLELMLEKISKKIADFFEINGKREKPQRVTIMLHDQDADALVARIVFDKDQGIKFVRYFSGKGHKGIARKLFDEGLNKNIRRVSEWKDVEWRRGAKGSIIGGLVRTELRKLGVIVVSSDLENAFTEEQNMVLQRLSRSLAPALERVLEHLDQLRLDSKFGSLLPYGEQYKDIAVYNSQYLMERLEASLLAPKDPDKPVSSIFIDIDHFKDLNEVWSHDEVDYVLAEIFARMRQVVRDGEIYRHGGEEFVIRQEGGRKAGVAVAKRILSTCKKDIVVRIPYATLDAAQRRRDDLYMVMNKPKQHTKAKKHPNHGIKSVELVTGREGKPFLVVTLNKTVSIGVATATAEDNPESLVRRSDSLEALAKHQGRFRIVVEGEDGFPTTILPE